MYIYVYMCVCVCVCVRVCIYIGACSGGIAGGMSGRPHSQYVPPRPQPPCLTGQEPEYSLNTA